MYKLLLFTLVFGASLILSISNRIATAAELNNQVFALVENSSQVTFSDLYAEYGEDAIYNFVFPGGIRGGYNRPPSQELYDHHWKGTVEMLIGKEQGNRELAESLPVDERQNALDAAKEATDALAQLTEQGVIDCWNRHDCPPLQVESMLILATTTSSIAPSNVSQSSEYSLAEWLRPTSMLLSSYEISPTERAADITVTFKTTPTPAGYALNIDFYVNDSDDSHLGPGIYYRAKPKLSLYQQTIHPHTTSQAQFCLACGTMATSNGTAQR